MKETLDYVEGKMDQNEFFGILGVSAIKAVLAVIGILIVGLAVYYLLIPSVTSGSAGLFVLVWAVTLMGFIVVFRPKEWFGWGGFIAFFIYTGIYSAIMYIGGETIFIAMILLGIVVALILVFGDVFFTGYFMYNDLKEWVKREQRLLEEKKTLEEKKNEVT